MRDDVTKNFDDYILGKKIRLLHHLNCKLYSLAQYFHIAQKSRYTINLDSESDCFMLEIKGTELLSIDQRLRLHSLLYKRLKPKVSRRVKLGLNGQTLLFEQLEEVWQN